MVDGPLMMLMMGGIVLAGLLVLAVLVFGVFALIKYLRGPK